MNSLVVRVAGYEGGRVNGYVGANGRAPVRGLGRTCLEGLGDLSSFISNVPLRLWSTVAISETADSTKYAGAGLG